MPILSTGGFETYDELQSKITVRENQITSLHRTIESGLPELVKMKAAKLIGELRGQVEALQKQIDGE